MLTILPFFRLYEFTKGCNGYAVAYYPLVGLILGAVIYLINILLAPFLPHNFLISFLFFLYILLYGALHLDGFTDSVDGLFVHDKIRALVIMKEPTIGAMGAIFVVLFLIMKFSILLDLQNFWLFICIPMLSRWSICVSILFFKYVRLDGMGALIKQEYNTNLFLYSSVYTLLIGICLIGVLFGYLFLLCTATTLLMSYCFSKRFNGLSGDMYGFIIEVNELILLACLVIVFK